MVVWSAMEDMDDTLVISEAELLEMAVSRTTTRRRRPSYIGLSPFTGARDLPAGTELYGPKGQRGYIAGPTADGLIVFEMVEGHGSDRRHVSMEVRPEAFAGWTTSGGVRL